MEIKAFIFFAKATAERFMKIFSQVRSGNYIKTKDMVANGVYTGRVIIKEPEDAVQLEKDLEVLSVTLKANMNNKGEIYVGNSEVSKKNGYVLFAGESVRLEVDNLSKVFVDGNDLKDKVNYIAEVNILNN